MTGTKVAGAIFLAAALCSSAGAQGPQVAARAPHGQGLAPAWTSPSTTGHVPRQLVRPGRWQGSGRWDNSGHHHHHHPGGPGYWALGYYGYVDANGDGYVETEDSPDMYGFFRTGGSVEMVNGTPVYAYDRSYPYEFGSGSVTVHRGSFERGAQRGYRCDYESVPDSQNRVTQVRVCRR